ncbi:hypothetical protein Gbro_3117 [Gordonia bronchialis DSM 43247]|uniref:DUF3052 domain-containing protein n=1 Tax=Gordonia bronchialis (strain ATCC 25592 / DSM 43247 / BCRC 13721 / JCM 3198 / KCTC 3076 / NBRC 16047 / NCTC 10667) TaxID=526226 RepID=D0LBT6_GORB4|nr:DUF3052 domain-containing protein [Gordonia bronchialis]ACY22323.1 hypothetical protein Gbro_3117 [Gordonia bronchialis DSM 43247]MCC3325113.1 DUF3052 domain-containing protein [Gordonia bronchialis]QGS24147.1 DUF3052 family protein [Gordonia bronchialis]UAK39668.1 DUF3052 domain-containing protein [Gordonia bronchialis]STQ65249.1 Protein of uncharacterised function (DUF3052) [Gordonia bronchialis]
MVAATDGNSADSRAQKLGLQSGMVVQELGWDEDTDDDLRADIEDAIGADMLDDDSDDVIDVVVLWWRDDDGDLVDALMDAIGPLADDGFVWVFSPKTGNDGYVDPSEIAEAAPTAGLTQTSVVSLGEWSGSRLVQPKARSGKRP